jgi:hypothetical protein
VNRDDLISLAASAVRAGALPRDRAVPASSTVPADLTCSLCHEALGSAPAFRLRSDGSAFLLHAECFSAWIDVVVAAPRDAP